VVVVEVNRYTIEPGADLVRADLTGATLSGMRADSNTTWPDGFDPVAAGVTFE
jgi:hypothetical protein